MVYSGIKLVINNYLEKPIPIFFEINNSKFLLND